MSCVPAGFSTRRNILLARILVAALGCTAVIWGSVTLPMFWRQSTLELTAKRVIHGEPFKVEALGSELPLIDAVEMAVFCRPAALQSAAIIRLRILEETAAAARHVGVDAYQSSTLSSIRQSLACSPADPFLWLAHFGVENDRNGFHPDFVKYLRMSYLLGPNEGWIVRKRSYLALSVFDQLPPDLAGMQVNEFAGLLKSRMYSEAVAIFTGPGWPIREVLLSRMKDVPERDRLAFAKNLHDLGYEVVVPGIGSLDKRPPQ
jgi:hypothetical protein